MELIIQSILLGIIEGITEFVPISSTGHLIIISEFMSFSIKNSDTFNISIQLGAILAVVTLYKDYFINLIKNMIKQDITQLLKLIVATFPALFLGLLFYSHIKALFSPVVVAVSLGFGGIIMILVEKLSIKKKQLNIEVEDISIKQAFIIGCYQCFALIPGMSRSGSTIVGGLLTGLNHSSSARFSFILSVPVITAAVAYDLLKNASSIDIFEFKLILIGFVVSYGVGLLSMKYFINLLAKHSLVPFAYYRILVSLLLLLYFFM